ncbi:MAG: hypothetical protein GC154_20870 [bacterium]|nr:hypothetical protein [bacterium]
MLVTQFYQNKIAPFVAVLFLFLASTAPFSFSADLKADFIDPPLRYAPRPLWFWNNTAVNAETAAEQMRLARDRCGYGGFGILPFGEDFKPEYLSEDYFQVYGAALKQARALGMTMCLYDEYGFPSGSAGAINGDGIPRFANRFPSDTIKRLDKHEWSVRGPDVISFEIPDGALMSVVAMETNTRQRINLTPPEKLKTMEWSAPSGDWKIMAFVCVKDGDPNVDYLNPVSVAHFIEMTHQAYYDRFKDYFGTTIDGTFFDETTLYRAQGRVWTENFNEKFRDRYGFDPAPFYPALWYDIGLETQAARNYLFGFRTELYASGFAKTVDDWCAAHGITVTGHQDQEEVINPVSVSGDLMKCFKYQAIPGIDKIGGDRPAERFYKIVSSSAYNWDKSLVMSETYGAMGDMDWDEIYSVAMEQYTKGINMLIPHAVWYDDKNVTFKPELSWRHLLYAGELPEFTQYLSRLNVLLQNKSRHVADVAILYPIATLQAGHYLDGPLGYYKGGVEIPEADYVEIGEMLATRLCVDYTFIHPEILDEKCRIESNTLILDNPTNYETYKVLIIPAHKTIGWSNLEKIRDFYNKGGQVIATGVLPDESAEFGCGQQVRDTIQAMFSSDSVIRTNQNGGRAVFIQNPTPEVLRNRLDRMLNDYDAAFQPGHELRYIHKVYQDRDIYFFANLHKQPVASWVLLRGGVTPEIWNPHTGEITAPQFKVISENGITQTRVWIDLPPMRSTFIVSNH